MHDIAQLFSLTYLPSLQKQRPVHRSKPNDSISGLQVCQFAAPMHQKVTQTTQQFRGGGLVQCAPKLWDQSVAKTSSVHAFADVRSEQKR
ncbi:hypothetical protein TYRP_000228 [Tyrophagus putrescentiae]|nr:hypothetical protein TYRP_000228 [Tyrophagus putrescentiae]